MACDISGEQLWSWIDRDAPELEEHLAICPTCRANADRIREEIGALGADDDFVPRLPKEIGPYEVKRLIGEGGQAFVYEAEQPDPRRMVAVKVLKGGHLIDKRLLRKFRRESHALGRLNHPNVATVYQAGRTSDGLHYFAMELVDGEPLHTYVKTNKLERDDVLALFRKLCDAIHYAHENGVIHRDIKPSNIMVDRRGEPKILDFGLARVTYGDLGTLMTATTNGRVEGTPRYMSPEQARGQVDRVDARTDVYALGVVLYELLTGKPPNEVTVISPDSIRAICEEPPPKPSEIAPDMGGELDAILLKALEKDQDRRYQTVAEFGDDIDRYLRGEPIVARPPGLFYSMRKRLVRRKAAFEIAGVAAVVVVTALVLFSKSGPSPDPERIRRIALRHKFDLMHDGPSDLEYYQAKQLHMRFPESPEALLLSAEASCLKKEQPIATALLTPAIAGDPDYWPYRLLLDEIRFGQRTGPSETADTSYWTADLAKSADAWYLRSFATLDIDKSLRWAERALERDPEHEMALSAVAYYSQIDGDTEQALAASKKLIDTFEETSSSWCLYRIDLLAEEGRFEEALKDCNSWVERTPNVFQAYNLRAKIERHLGRYQDAERDLTVAINKHSADDPTTTWLHFHRGNARWLIGDIEGAIEDCQRSFETLTYPTFGTARLFILLHETGRPEEAASTLARARRSDQIGPWLRQVLDCLAGEYTPAEFGALAEKREDPVERTEGYYYAGEAALLAGTADQAVVWFKKCVDTGVGVDPEDPLETITEYQLARLRLSELDRRTATEPEGGPLTNGRDHVRN